MLPSIFWKYMFEDKIYWNCTKSLLIVNQHNQQKQWGFCDVTAFCYLTSPLFPHFYQPQLTLRIHWRLWTILKTSNKSTWSNIFWYAEVCILWKWIQYTIYWDKIQILKKIRFRQNKRYTKCPHFSFARSNSSQFYS